MAMSSPTIPRPAHTERGTALLALLAGALVIGVAPVLVRFADAGPVTVAFWRLLFSLPLLTVLARRSPGGVGGPSRLAVLAGLAFALDLAFWHNGIANTSILKPAFATIVGSLSANLRASTSLSKRTTPIPNAPVASATRPNKSTLP